MKPTLLVLAAGMGSRYGALKQMDGVGPNNESILDYSVFDAKRAGFGKVVFVIREDFAENFKKINNKERYGIDVEYVYQSIDNIPANIHISYDRKKPWGTAHAVMCAKNVINEPFAVINADDFYGKEAYEVLYNFLKKQENSTNEYAMVAYKLKNTLSDFGTVSRGVCTQDADNHLQTVTERTSIERKDDKIACTENDEKHILDDDALVSMNFWGFTKDFFEYLDRDFITFINTEAQTNEKAEFFIPLVVNNLIESKQAKVKVLSSNAKWFGVTYKEDKPFVVKKIKDLIKQGVYPEKLW